MRGATRRKAPEFLTSVGSGLALVDDDDDYSIPSWGAPPITTTIVTVVAIVANVVTVVAIVAIVTTPHPQTRRSPAGTSVRLLPQSPLPRPLRAVPTFPPMNDARCRGQGGRGGRGGRGA
mmetsp:Transcript_841/g.2351  ORF Transcript_841/g.2351 Transcript_841/m.2351 type:complete len:120 (-) Transcript_841:168-527(-)